MQLDKLRTLHNDIEDAMLINHSIQRQAEVSNKRWERILNVVRDEILKEEERKLRELSK